MDQLLTELIGQSPIAVAVIVVVMLMLRHSAKRDEQFIEAINRQWEKMDLIAKDCHDVQREALAAMRESSATTAELKEAISRLSDTTHGQPPS